MEFGQSFDVSVRLSAFCVIATAGFCSLGHDWELLGFWLGHREIVLGRRGCDEVLMFMPYAWSVIVILGGVTSK